MSPAPTPAECEVAHAGVPYGGDLQAAIRAQDRPQQLRHNYHYERPRPHSLFQIAYVADWVCTIRIRRTNDRAQQRGAGDAKRGEKYPDNDQELGARVVL